MIKNAEDIRNIEDLRLEDITPDFLLEQCIEMGDGLGIDTRQGSLYRDAAAGHMIRTENFFDNLRMVNKIISLDTCTGEVLDEYMRMRGLKRNPSEATSAQYYVEFVGNTPPAGALMLCQGHFFTLAETQEGERHIIISKEKGSTLNDLRAGMPVIPDIDVDNLISATLQELAVPGCDIEDDESARQRLINRISGPDENGNRSQFRTWCESVEGVGKARIISLWNGANTVGGVIIAEDGGVPSKEVVENVQEYVDPGCTGMGEGAASIGQFFTAFAAEPVVINVSVMVIKSVDATYDEVRERFTEKLKEYCKNIAMAEFSPDIKVRYSRIGAVLSDVDSVIDYEDLKINGSTENISFDIYHIPVIGEVNIHGDIS